MTWFVTSKSIAIEQPGMDMGIPDALARLEQAASTPAASRSVGLRRPGLKPHVGHLDFFLVGASGFLGRIELLQIGMNDEPEIGCPDGRIGHLHDRAL